MAVISFPRYSSRCSAILATLLATLATRLYSSCHAGTPRNVLWRPGVLT